MNGWVIFAAILLSLGGLVYLAWTDPKRRRTHDLPKIERRPVVWPARIATFGPGVYLTVIGHWSGLAIWAGAVTTLGWIMAAITPETYAKLSADIRTYREQGWMKAQQMLQHLSKMPARYVPERLKAWRNNLPRLSNMTQGTTQPAEIEELKARITALEARLHRLEQGEVADIADLQALDRVELPGDEHKLDKPLDAAE